MESVHKKIAGIAIVVCIILGAGIVTNKGILDVSQSAIWLLALFLLGIIRSKLFSRKR